MNRRKPIVLLVLSLCLSAQAQYGVNHWTVEQGLPQNLVRCITQTPDGYLWIATLDGLVRFDGVRFTVFDRRNTTGMISNRFAGMDRGRNGDLWLTNEIGGLTRYHEGAFRIYGSRDGVAGSAVNGAT